MYTLTDVLISYVYSMRGSIVHVANNVLSACFLSVANNRPSGSVRR